MAVIYIEWSSWIDAKSAIDGESRWLIKMFRLMEVVIVKEKKWLFVPVKK